MSDENNKSTDSVIEDRINSKIKGDSLKNALDFVAFLRENDIWLDYNASESGYGGWNGAVGGTVGNSIGYATFNGDVGGVGPWTFWFNSCDFDGSDSADDEFKNAIWAFASSCGKCNDNWEKCMGSGKRTILGKEFENQCHSPLMFINPDTETLENMKKFLLYLKPEIDGIQTELAENQRRRDLSDSLRDVFIEKMNSRVFRSEPVDIDLRSMVKYGDFETAIDANGLMQLYIEGNRGNFSTLQKFNAPLKIELRCKKSYSNQAERQAVQLGYGKNSWVYIRQDGTLFIHNLIDGAKNEFPGCGHVPLGEFFNLEWFIDREFIAVKINGDIRHIGNTFSYVDEFKNNPDYSPLESVHITARWGATLTVESLRVTEL